MALARFYQGSYRLTLSKHRFTGWLHVEVFVFSSLEVAIKPVGVTQTAPTSHLPMFQALSSCETGHQTSEGKGWIKEGR